MRTIAFLACVLLVAAIANGQVPSVVYPGPVAAIEIDSAQWPDVIMETRAENCPPCDVWIERELPAMLKAGLRVLIVPTNAGITPRYELNRDGKTTEHIGFIPAAKLRELLRR